MTVAETPPCPHSRPWEDSSFTQSLELIPVMTWLADAQGNCRYVNPQWKAFTGVSDDCDDWEGAVHPDDREARRTALLSAKKEHTAEYRLRQGDGSYALVRDRVVPLSGHDGYRIGFLGTSLDVTTCREHESRLLASEALNNCLLDSSHDCIKLLDREGNLLFMSSGGQRRLGISDITPYLMQSWCDLWPEPHRTEAHAAMTAATAGDTGNFVGRFTGADGISRWWDVIITPVIETPGTEPLLLAISRDITEQKLATEALRNSEAEYRALFELSAVGIGQTDCNSGRFQRVNRKYCEIVGYSVEELDGLTFMDLTPPDDQAPNRELFEALMRGEIADYTLEKRLIRKSGELVWVQVTATALRDEDNRPTSLLAIIEDISNRKTAEQALAASEARKKAQSDEMRVLLETVPAIVAVAHDPKGLSVTGNPAAYRILGIPLDTNLSQSVPAGQHETPFRAYREGRPAPPAELPIGRALRGEPAYGDEVELRYENGDVLHLIGNAEPLRDQDGNIRGAVSAFMDVTDRKLSENALRQKTRELEAANRELEAFSYSVSHDLQAPLRAINGYSRILEEDYAGGLDDAGLAYLGRIRGATLHMSSLIDGLLSLSRVFRAKLQLRNVDLSSLAADTAQRLVEEEPARTVRFDIESGLTTVGDPALLELLLQNLFANAWKFTRSRPEARIELKAVPERRRGVYVVRDNGVGFEAEYAHKLFQPFERLHRAEEFEGTGIGLATVRRIVQRHGGRAWAEGVPGEGAAFFFTLGADGQTESD